ncbi:MAG: membrane protein [Candidatus Parcubacteria bacterium]|nr:MAG: membrane protein [Candidatus Parcubacteria bacterium]
MSTIELQIIFKSLIASFWLGITLSLLGIFVFIRKMTFFSDGIAHATIFSLALAFLLNFNIFFTSLIFVILLALIIFILENKTKIHTDTIIGIIFVTFLSLGLILMSRKASYQPELLNFLLGNILLVNNFDFILTIILNSLILILIIINFEKIMFSLIDPNEARLRKLNPKNYQLLFYFLLAISVILGIKISGIILVSAFLILPAATSSLISTSLRRFIFLTLLIALINISLGFLISFKYFFPLGASITLIGSILFFAAFILKLALKF